MGCRGYVGVYTQKTKETFEGIIADNLGVYKV